MSLASIPVEKVKGVGPSLLEKLHQIKIVSVKDLLEYFPYRYENFELIDIHRAMHEEKSVFNILFIAARKFLRSTILSKLPQLAKKKTCP